MLLFNLLSMLLVLFMIKRNSGSLIGRCRMPMMCCCMLFDDDHADDDDADAAAIVHRC
jgi:hypothetical protein